MENKNVKSFVNMSRFKSFNKKILKYNSNIYLANGVLLKERFLSVLELLFQIFHLDLYFIFLCKGFVLPCLKTD